MRQKAAVIGKAGARVSAPSGVRAWLKLGRRAAVAK